MDYDEASNSANDRHSARERALADWADQHCCVISLPELRALGFTPAQINRRVSQRRLTKLARGVYKVGPGRLTQRGRFRAALLAGGRGAVLVGRSAAALHEIRPDSRTTVDIATPKQRRSRREVRVHCFALDAQDVIEIDGLRVTALARTLVDLASTHERHVTRAITRADKLHLFDLYAIDDLFARHPTLPGVPGLRRALRAHHPQASATNSMYELAYLLLITKADLPPAKVNHRVLDEEVDFHWAQLKLVVEIDGPDHDTAFQRAKDHARDEKLRAAGWTVLRFPTATLRTQPGHVLAETRLAIARARGALAAA